jgi:hypothetical protein
MLSERYRPKTWDGFVGQPVIDEIREACGTRGCSTAAGSAGCLSRTPLRVAGKRRGLRHGTGAGYDEFSIERIDSRSVLVADFRELEGRMVYGWGGSGHGPHSG